MLLYCPVWLYFVPGLIGLSAGLLVLIFLLRGPVLFLGHYWDAHLMVFASVISIFSYQLLSLGIFAHNFAIAQGFIKYDALTLYFQKRFNLEKGLIIGSAMTLVGFIVFMFIIIEWFSKNFGELSRIRESIFAMTFMIIGLQTIFSSFFLSLLFLKRK
jgi:hypothetical protein